MAKTFNIGDKVYAYDTEAREPSVFETVVCGLFINIESGYLFYYLPNSKQPAYAVHATEEEAKENLAKFMAFRAKVAELQKDLDAEREALGSINYKEELAGILYPPKEGEE